MKKAFEILISSISLWLLPLAGIGLAQWRNYDQGYSPGMWGWRMMGFMSPFMMIVLWIFIIVVIVLMVRWIKSSSDHVQGESALDILKKRYAKGEISREEFETMKKDVS